VGTFALIGPGRAGRSLINALAGTRWHCAAVYRRDDDVSDAAEGVDALVIAVPDDALATVAGSVRPRPTTVVIHLSGAKSLDALAPHGRRASVHPLVSLPDPETGASRLTDNAMFAVAGDGLARDLVATLDGEAFDVAESDRTLYHATAAIASNHLVVLCAQVERLARHLDLPFDLYGRLMAESLENVRQIGASAALTGPAARGDVETVDAHIAALERVGAHEGDLYRVWSAEAARLGSAGHNRVATAQPDSTES
jgi:predicted short-subunit dehydrogenase-like oxidoreductase (DUF2520 family)